VPSGANCARVPAAGLLTVAFGTTVAMWGVGYVGRLPVVELPSPAVLVAILACLPVGGLLLARQGGTVLDAATAGATTGVLNLLVLGSFLSASSGVGAPSWLVWIPGSIGASAALAAAGAALGTRSARPPEPATTWVPRFAWVAVGATLLLLGAGGLVTSAEAGLAVADWPTSFGYNMFLYPFSRMTGGIYYEHAHRLIGALVGLTTVTLAFTVARCEARRAVRWFAWALVLAVAVQGTLGGMRVTERSLGLAIGHAILAQLFFAGLVLLATVTSRGWITAEPAEGDERMDRVAGGLLVALLVVQVALGAAQRHLGRLLLLHVLVGVAFVIPFTLRVAIRTAASAGNPVLRRLGSALGVALAIQVTLGFAAWIATAAVEAGSLPRAFDLALATAHQWFGAILLATAVMRQGWSARTAPGRL
jgi:heme a synthase